jgi:hypothetical protein
MKAKHKGYGAELKAQVALERKTLADMSPLDPCS